MVYMSAISAPIIIQIVSTLTWKMNKYWYLAILFGAISCGIGLLFIFLPTIAFWAFSSLESLRGSFGSFANTANNTISESQPLLSPYGKFTLELAWGCFGFVLLFGLTGLIILVTRLKKRPELLFAWIWCLAMLLATIMQRRFGYYSAATMCLTSAYMFYVILNMVGWRKHSKREVKKQGKEKVYFSPVIAVVGAIIILAAVVIPSAYLTSREARNHPYLMTVAWKEAINYLRDETPKTNNYGVLSWWDYGYWIAREGQRPATCHPGGGHTLAAAMFLTAQTTEEANSIIIPLKCDYVVIDFLMVRNKFYAIPLLAGKGTFTEQQYNECIVVRLYYSESGLEGYREVFESSTKYEGQSQVKIYQRYVPLKEPCNCGNN
jgi:dolichyl-diphosphooligosaccharide--protein glycosyltransferase